MAVTEDFDSRNERFTMQGHTLERRFTCTWDEWASWKDQIDNDGYWLPIVGDLFREDVPELRCADIACSVLSGGGNDNCSVVVLYSTEGWECRKERPDEIGSWEMSYDMRPENRQIDTYWDVASETWEQWAVLWATNHNGEAEENNPPELFYEDVKAELALVCYSSSQMLEEVLGTSNAVNNDDFVSWLQSKMSNTLDEFKLSNLTEAKLACRWKFQGCRATPIKSNCIRYEMLFVYKSGGWQKDYDISTNLYKEMAFINLFQDMAKSTEETVGHR